MSLRKLVIGLLAASSVSCSSLRHQMALRDHASITKEQKFDKKGKKKKPFSDLYGELEKHVNRFYLLKKAIYTSINPTLI